MSQFSCKALWVFYVCLLSLSSLQAQTLSEGLANGEELALQVGVNGEVAEVLVQAGDKVKQGQVLLKLNSKRYLSKRDETLAGLEAAKFNEKLVKDNFMRQQELYEEGSLSTVELQHLELDVMRAHAELASARAAYHAANRDLESTQIKALLAGTIVAVPLVGQRVNIETGSAVLVKMRVE